VPVAEWPPEMRQAMAALVPPNPRHPPVRREGRPKGLNVLGTFARHPALAEAYQTFNGHLLFNTTLTPRQRELLILRVAALRNCRYEWAQHVVMARDEGLTDEEIDRVRRGPDAPEWHADERALLRATDELIAGARISDAIWAELAGELDEQQLMDLVFTVGAYDLVAMVFLSLGVELDEDLAAYVEDR
jgi:AhpD family alkylhydroperoxidase